jgi:hypothetical protein
MRTRRVTISVPADVARRMKQAAADGSVSAWVTGIIEERLDDAALDRQWRDFYASVSPRPSDVRRADALFKRLTRPRRRKSAP